MSDEYEMNLPYEYNSEALGDYYLGFIRKRPYYSILYLITGSQ